MCKKKCILIKRMIFTCFSVNKPRLWYMIHAKWEELVILNVNIKAQDRSFFQSTGKYEGHKEKDGKNKGEKSERGDKP